MDIGNFELVPFDWQHRDVELPQKGSQVPLGNEGSVPRQGRGNGVVDTELATGTRLQVIHIYIYHI